jgi:two-component system OmpR family sensor kinase
MSIRARLTIAITIVLLAIVAILGAVTVQSTRAMLIEQVDDQVRTFADYMKHKPDKKNGPPPDSTVNIYDPQPSDDDWGRNDFARLVYTEDGLVVDAQYYGYADNPASPPDCPDIPSDELDAIMGEVVTLPSIDGTLEYRTLMQPIGDGQIQAVGTPLTGVDDTVSNLLRVVLIAGAVALLAAIGICWWVIRQGLKPVDHMVATAAAIADGDLGARIEHLQPGTELGRLGTALNDMMGKIQKADDARTAGEHRLRRFVADAAHELRTPLTSLRGYAELYRQGALKDDASVTNAMGRIESEGARMARLVDDLLLLARLDQDRGLERVPVDLGTLVSDAVEDFRVVTPDRPVNLTLDEGTVVAGDRMRLRQVIDNLLSNVRTHTPSGTDVRVAVASVEGAAVLTVADSGPGVAAENQERIFERFWRADPARARGKGGTGLGLAIVASLVEAHDGSIEIESEPGQGATFTVRLPLASS